MSEAGAEHRFNLHYQLSEIHLAKLIQICQKSLWGSWKPYLIATAGYVVVIVIALLIADTYGLSMRKAATIMLLAAVAHYFTGRIFGIVLRPNLASKGGCLTGSVTMTVTSGGIDFVHQHYQTAFLWSAILRVINSTDVIVLMTDQSTGLLIPKTAFASDQEIVDFLQFVAMCIENAKLTDE